MKLELRSGDAVEQNARVEVVTRKEKVMMKRNVAL